MSTPPPPFSEDNLDDAPPPPPDSPPEAPLHIPGAATAIMALLVASLSILFLGSIILYLIVRSENMAKLPVWPPPGFPPPPKSLWISTLVILMTSATIQLAIFAVRRDDDKKLRVWLDVTFGLGLLFLIVQTFNWLEFYRGMAPGMQLSGPYLGMFYILTGLHAAHVVGGLIPLGMVMWKAHRGRYSRNFHPGVRYCAIYWHFLDVIWLALFSVLMLS